MKRIISKKWIIITLLTIALVIVLKIYLSNTDDNEIAPQLNWIHQPTLIYEGQAYFLDPKYKFDIDTLNLKYIGILKGRDDLLFKPEDNFEANTLIGYYLFTNKSDNSNKYIYVSPSLSVDDSEVSVFKR